MPEIDEMLTIEPPPAAFMCGIANFIPRKTPRALTAISRSQAAVSEQVLDRAAAEAGIVDENVESAELGESGVDRRLPFRFASDVEMAENRRPVRLQFTTYI